MFIMWGPTAYVSSTFTQSVKVQTTPTDQLVYLFVISEEMLFLYSRVCVCVCVCVCTVVAKSDARPRKK